MDGPVKDRLTGALILIAALVIIVPEMLLRPKPGRGPADPVPAAEAEGGPPLRTYSLELGAPTSTGAGGQSAAAAAAPVVTSPAAPVAAAATPPVVSPTATPAVPPITAPPLITPSPNAAQPVASSAAGPSPVVSRNIWWAQLGSFSGRDNAERLARQLRTAGFVMDVSKTRAAGKDLYRVRAGPVASREAALALQGRLAAVGHKASLVAP